MWAFVIRKLLYNVPVYLSILLLLMLCLRVRDPVPIYLGKNASPEEIELVRSELGLDQPLWVQYGDLVKNVVRLDFSEESWQYPGDTVGEMLRESIPPSMSITIPTLLLSAGISVIVALLSAFYRGRLPDRLLVFLAVIGMSVSFLIYIIFGQFVGAFWPSYQKLDFQPFAISGYSRWWAEAEPLTSWAHYYLLPVIIGVVVAMGYDTRFYRAVMVEESSSDYIVTAMAKGAGRRKVMFVHMLKNAMIPIITRIMATLPFLITGNILLELYFGIPGMGKTLIDALSNQDFPVIQAFVSVIAALFILSIILTDVLYALVDPRVRLS